jgi:hypothetical protein
MRKHLTYANVMVTLLAIGALTGGVAYAADTIGSEDVIDNSLASRDLRNNVAVQGVDVRNGTLSNADVGCPNGMTPVGSDLCIDVSDRPASPTFWAQALTTCSNAGYRLPSLTEALEADAALPGGKRYWTGDTFEYFLDGPSTQKVQEAWSYTHGQSFFGDIYATSNAVRCVTTR